MKILVASGNRKKLEEMRRIAEGLAVEVVGPADVGMKLPEVVEDGATFAENARKKARAFALAAGLPAVADDSGLCVEALEGAPGVRSARFSGEAPAPDRDERNNERLLEVLRGVPAGQRGAHFTCALCLALPGGGEVEVERSWEGQVAFWPRGAGGFGYDSLFLLPQLGRTSAELTLDEKNARSHRGQAMRALKALLERLA